MRREDTLSDARTAMKQNALGESPLPLLESHIPGLPVRRGKVRDVYDLGDDRLLIVATDRISAFDSVMPTPIPDKGRILTGLSAFWFRYLDLFTHPVMKAGEIVRTSLEFPQSELPGDPIDIRHHLLSTEIDDAGLDLPESTREALIGRCMIVRKVEVIPYECVVRGYLSGSAWKEYKSKGTVCKIPLPEGLRESESIERIFTPATKAASGHDENISYEQMSSAIGNALAQDLKLFSKYLYSFATLYARKHGKLILADTKFEWGKTRSGELLLIDEILTPDSSRYWPADQFKPGGPQPSFDKQFVRDWLETSGWDKNSPPPELPEEIVMKTREKYVQCYELLTGQTFPWK